MKIDNYDLKYILEDKSGIIGVGFDENVLNATKQALDNITKGVDLNNKNKILLSIAITNTTTVKEIEETIEYVKKSCNKDMEIFTDTANVSKNAEVFVSIIVSN